MASKKKQLKTYKKVIYAVYPLAENQGGGIIKIEAWEDSNRTITKYSMAYINHIVLLSKFFFSPFPRGQALEEYLR